MWSRRSGVRVPSLTLAKSLQPSGSCEFAGGIGREGTHRPDLGVQTGSGPVAIEVELQRKVRARLVGILRMYEAHTDTEAGTLSGVIYVCDRDDVADAVRRAADDAWLRPPALSFRAMHDIVEETRTAAELHKAVAGS